MEADAIIIGSGQAGVPLAIKLARTGTRVLLAERMRMICTIPILPGGDEEATVEGKHAPGRRRDTGGRR